MRAAFKTEADMLRPLACLKSSLVGDAEDIEVFYEVQSAAGIPDLVLVIFDHEQLTLRSKRGLAPIDSLHAIAVMHETQSSLIRGDDYITASEISKCTGISASSIAASVLPGLQSAGHVEKIGRGKWKATHEFRSLAKFVCTIEVKMRDWRSGYNQALRHSVTADEAWLVLDACHAKAPSDNSKWFKKAGIGLAFLDGDSGLDAQVKARSRRKMTPYRELLVERAAGLYLQGDVSGPVRPVFGVRLTTTTGPDPRFRDAEGNSYRPVAAR
ncbi:hypothetical protein [Streptomyces sp. NPDC008139]|uniref:hypothetical protein n=1 Tax=Streptomyces sp. NPDC008139 TaxID=3364814 RepID=UPI0036EDB9F9